MIIVSVMPAAPSTASALLNQAEFYDPVLNRWTAAATMGAPRMYHSAGVLLPDGRVVADYIVPPD